MAENIKVVASNKAIDIFSRIPFIGKRLAFGRLSRTGSKPKRDTGRAARFGRTLLMILALVVLVGPILLIAHPISYVPLLLTILVIVLSWLYLQVLRRSLAMSVADMSSSVERGQKAALAVSVSNSSILPFPRIEMEFFVTDLFGSYDDVTKLTCALGSRRTETLDFDVRFAHLGSYQAGIDHMVIHDLLGLFSARVAEGASRSVVVRPRKISMSSVDMQVISDETHNMLKAIVSDDMDYASVREYRYGDPLKTIHWNLTSRSPGAVMYTRLFETFVNPTLAIVLDPYSPSYNADELMSLFDGMVESSAAISRQAREAGIDAEVRYIDRTGSPDTTHLVTSADADDLIMGMLRITPAEDVGAQSQVIEQMVRNVGNAAHGFGNVTLVTSRLDAGLITALIELRMHRRNVMAFVAVPRALEGREREQFLAPLKRLQAAQIAHYVVESTEVETMVVGL